MRFTWKVAKRKLNLRDHELDYIDAARVFEGPTATYEDDRFRYEEQRFITLGLLVGVPVSIAHTEAAEVIHVISFRRATPYEETFLFESIEDQLPTPPPEPRIKDKAHRRAPGARSKANRSSYRKKGA